MNNLALIFAIALLLKQEPEGCVPYVRYTAADLLRDVKAGVLQRDQAVGILALLRTASQVSRLGSDRDTTSD